MPELREYQPAGLRFAAAAGNVEGYGGRGVDGIAYRPPGDYLYKDNSGGAWWIVFHQFQTVDPRTSRRRGDVLACSESHGELVHVRVLAANVSRAEADAAFRENTPSSYEEAVRVAARIPTGLP
ncbi:hypothetical protein ACS5PJ_16105 [Pseudarthrobacter sp. YS3]|jgi:hypothetical protein|uniref:hypothetical protein n=1 Tax=Pseudarthrobacter sp. YS3 TaxID=3453718 RepID=UPI003EE8D965